MRYASISDVHANEAALRAVLTDANDARAEKVICLGDVLGYGPEPVAALELVYRRAHVVIANAATPHILQSIFSGRDVGTFVPGSAL